MKGVEERSWKELGRYVGVCGGLLVIWVELVRFWDLPQLLMGRQIVEYAHFIA